MGVCVGWGGVCGCVREGGGGQRGGGRCVHSAGLARHCQTHLDPAPLLSRVITSPESRFVCVCAMACARDRESLYGTCVCLCV